MQVLSEFEIVFVYDAWLELKLSYYVSEIQWLAKGCYGWIE